ncbi:hypothetical protein ACFLRF_02015 [Candidatus Altiarchaeota archaeon]
MGFAVDTVKTTLKYMRAKKDIHTLIMILPAIVLIEGGLTFAGLGLLAIPILIVRAVLSLLFFIVGYTYVKEKSIYRAFTSIPRYFLRLLALVILGILATCAAAIPFILFSVALGPLVMLLIPLMIIPFMYVSVRLSLILAVIVLEDLRVMDAIKRSWDVTRGNVINIFAASILISLIIMSLYVPVILLQLPEFMMSVQQGASGANSQGFMASQQASPFQLFILNPFIQAISSIQSLSGSILCAVMLSKLKPKQIKHEEGPAIPGMPANLNVPGSHVN